MQDFDSGLAVEVLEENGHWLAATIYIRHTTGGAVLWFDDIDVQFLHLSICM